MSEVKFACPVCGQHIRCDSTKSGTQMDCPTCFRKMIVPEPAASGDSKLVLSAALVQAERPAAELPSGSPMTSQKPNRSAAIFGIGLLVIACAAAGGMYAFRDKIFSSKPTATNDKISATNAVALKPEPLDPGTNWSLSLAERKTPNVKTVGFVNGHSFSLDRASVSGGTLSFRQGNKTSPRELSVTIHLFAKQGEDLANQTVSIDAGRTNAPKVVLRWRIGSDSPATASFQEGYALRIVFGDLTNGRLTGNVYLCVPDAPKSWIAGNFTAEIRKPPPPKPPKVPKPITQSTTPKR
jgi:hypothetical protein